MQNIFVISTLTNFYLFAICRSLKKTKSVTTTMLPASKPPAGAAAVVVPAKMLFLSSSLSVKPGAVSGLTNRHPQPVARVHRPPVQGNQDEARMIPPTKGRTRTSIKGPRRGDLPLRAGRKIQ